MNPTGSKEKSSKELPNEVRMVIAFILMGVILVATPFFYRKFGLIPPEQAQKTRAAKAQAAAAQPAAEAAKTTEQSPPAKTHAQPGKTETDAPPATAAATNPVAASAEQEFTIDTSLYQVVFSNRGAVVKSWMLKNFKDRASKSRSNWSIYRACRRPGFRSRSTFAARNPPPI